MAQASWDQHLRVPPMLSALRTNARLELGRLLRNTLLVVGGSLALTLSAKVQVPFWPVPITMQSMVALLIGIGFGSRLGALTILAYGTMVHVCQKVVEEAGVDAEIVDLRTLVPLDIEAIEESVGKTGRCMIVHEATRTSGFGAELSALVQERCFYHLEAPIERVTGFDTPYPHSLEWAYFPGPVRIGQALKKIMKD